MGVVNLGILIKKLSSVFLKKSEVDTVLGTAGYVKNTDYASQTTGGVIKVDGYTYGTRLTSGGTLYGNTFTPSQYSNGSNNLFISKGTLESVIASLVQRELIAALGGVDADASGTTLTAWKATKGDDGWTISATKS